MPPKPPKPEEVFDLEVPRMLLEEIPREMQDNFERDMERLANLPQKIDEDIARNVDVLASVPPDVIDTLYRMPGSFAENVNNTVETVKEGFEYTGDDEEKRGERMRRVTDIADLFTPT